jgi:hypothetical protein
MENVAQPQQAAPPPVALTLDQVILNLQTTLDLLARQNFELLGRVQAQDIQIHHLQTHLPDEHDSRILKVSPPPMFTGDREKSALFLSQCQLTFRAFPSTYAGDERKLLFTVSRLEGEPAKWYHNTVTADKTNNTNTFPTYAKFEEGLIHLFGLESSSVHSNAFEDMQRLKQTKSVQAFATKFLQLAVKTLANEATKMEFFRQGLRPEIIGHLLGLNPQPKTLDDMIQAATSYDDRMFRFTSTRENLPPSHTLRQQYQPAHPAQHPTYSTVTPVELAHPPQQYTYSTVTPMELDAQRVFQGKLSDAEKQRRRELGACVYCGKLDCVGGRDVNSCPSLMRKTGIGNNRQ